MRTVKLISLFAALLANFPLWAQSAASPATPSANQATNQPAYLTQVKHVAGLDLIPADFVYVTFETNKFGFVMPAGFRLETQDGQQVTLVSADVSCLLTFRVLEPMPPGVTELDPAPFRNRLLSLHPGGKILEEFSLPAVGQHGPVFDLRWNSKGAVARRALVLFIPSRAGVLEFSLVSSLDKFEAGRQGFRDFLGTFRAAQADGRLRMPQLSNRF